MPNEPKTEREVTVEKMDRGCKLTSDDVQVVLSTDPAYKSKLLVEDGSGEWHTVKSTLDNDVFEVLLEHLERGLSKIIPEVRDRVENTTPGAGEVCPECCDPREYCDCYEPEG